MGHVKYPRFGAESLNTLFQLHTLSKIALVMQTEYHRWKHTHTTDTTKTFITTVFQCSAYEESSGFQNLLLTPITLRGVCQIAAHRQ